MEYKEIAEKLWGLLDDIDTASDMFKPEDSPFYNFAMERAVERNKYMHSPDGYKLVLTDANASQCGKCGGVVGYTDMPKALPPTSKES